MKIYKFTSKGDELVLESNIIEEIQEFLKKEEQKGCSFVADYGLETETFINRIEKFAPKIQTIHILYHMAGR